MMEEAIKAQYSNDNNPDKDGVFQLTTLSSLPLKSPKRLIALQLANNNPAFRERFRQKLEQSGGLITMGKLSQGGLNSGLSFGGGWGTQYQGGSNTIGENNNDSHYSFEGELEKLINTPDWMRTNDTLFNTSVNSRSFLRQPDVGNNVNDTRATGAEEQANKYNFRKDVRTKRGGSKSTGFKDNDSETDEGKPLKLRQKRRKELDYDAANDSYEDSNRGFDHSNQSSGQGGNDSSIIKRRRKGELQIMVDASLNNPNAQNSAGPLTNAIRANNLHSLMGGGINIGDMGPPNDTPRRSARLKNGSLSTLSNLGTLNYLDSPFMEKTLLFSDGFGPFGVDTPSKLMHLDPPLSKGGEGVRFDFDEAVAAHFPSPRAGEHIKGSSPYRWSGGSVGSGVSGYFNFPDSSFPSQRNSSSIGATNSDSNTNLQQGQDTEQQSIYAKKFKKAFKSNKLEDNDSKRDSENSFQSPSQPPSQQLLTRSRTNSKVSISIQLRDRFC
jgi:hypothetical protein